VFSAVHDLEDPECLNRYPEAATAQCFEVDLAPGDILYVPVGWWHQVRSLDFCVMLTYTRFRWPNEPYSSFPDLG
jgi:ribosomal protein L16 Arg81 hydroxylase